MTFNKFRNAVFITATVCLLAGCLYTPKLFKAIEYSENISSILISEDRNKLVVIGKRYHYIFDAPKVIVNTLKSSFHKSTTAKFHPFYVDSDGITTGRFELTLHKEVTSQKINEMLDLGYKKSSSSNSKVYTVSGELKGIRYMSGNVVIPSEIQSLNREYKIKVLEQPGAVKKILLTPITVTADAVILIGVVPLSLFTTILSVSLQ